jgi:glycosyltransferase involved in cell wall biosynthesis
MHAERLRVAIIAGTLAQGGAEKQLVYMARALVAAGVDVRVWCLARGHYESALRELGIDPVWIGRRGAPPLRLAALVRALRPFRPHVVQAAHFYTNLYAALAAKPYGALSIGTMRSDGVKDLRDAGIWGRWLLRLPRVLVVNSRAARDHAILRGREPAAVHVIPSVLDAPTAARTRQPAAADGAVVALSVAGLTADKRLDRFLRALAAARRALPRLRGVIAGDGPDRGRLEALAAALGLTPEGVRFVGHSTDVPALFTACDIFVLTSDHEGCPNALLEAMAAGLPVITTPAGDAGWLVQDGIGGFVVEFDDLDGLVERMLTLGRSPELRTQFGGAGRERVTRDFRSDALSVQMISAYRTGARRMRDTGRPGMAALLGSAGLEDHVDAESGAG